MWIVPWDSFFNIFKCLNSACTFHKQWILSLKVNNYGKKKKKKKKKKRKRVFVNADAQSKPHLYIYIYIYRYLYHLPFNYIYIYIYIYYDILVLHNTYSLCNLKVKYSFILSKLIKKLFTYEFWVSHAMHEHNAIYIYIYITRPFTHMHDSVFHRSNATYTNYFTIFLQTTDVTNFY